LTFDTALKKKRVIGLVLLATLLSLFLVFNRLDKLDTVREDLAAATSPQVQCFQGFCLERPPESTLLSRWWDFSLTYLKLVTVGMVFAFLVAGLTEALLFPKAGGQEFSQKGIKGSLKGLIVGPPMTLCSACIVPVASAFRRRGAGIEATLAITQGSSTLNLPALVMVVLVFTPMLAGSRLVLGVVGALLIGPLVAMVVGHRGRATFPTPVETEAAHQNTSPWGRAFTEGLRDWAMASLRYLVRLGPIMVVAGFASGLAIQWVSPQTVTTFLGDNVSGVAIAATIGLLINVPLLFEIPLVAALLLIGMGTAPAATLLFTAASGGPITFWGLAKVMPKRAIGTFAMAIWGLGVAGGLGVLALGPLLPGDETGLLRSVTSPRAEVDSLSVPPGATQRSAGGLYSSAAGVPGQAGDGGRGLLARGPDGQRVVSGQPGVPRQYATGGGDDGNALAVLGPGLTEELAQDMTAALHGMEDRAVSIASSTGTSVFVELVTGGVSFGWLHVLPDGTIDTSRVNGVGADLVVKPAGQK
jgi:uncharacterized membrane protein YraQ (UPF0718 family)